MIDADLLDRLGGIAATRVLTEPPPRTATEADLLRINSRRDRICELIDGTLTEKSLEIRKSILSVELACVLLRFVQLHQLGVVVGAGCPLRMSNGNIRIPDISFISWDQLPGDEIPDEPVFHSSPFLVVDVSGTGNTPGEMRLRRKDYFASGTRLVWEISLPNRTVRVYASVKEPRLLTVEDQLDGGTVLPGFSMPVRDIFEVLERRG
ncbi:Uma2 family endonuclease [Zavarzinella formosa]|uniref:Uma2 family endonuclease n=1 Tax=Zavarzinella formosa TaxID=360055 RepID=UPI00030BC6FD|nr:Uma2 family endonuclease [Zavarzinella formosa]